MTPGTACAYPTEHNLVKNSKNIPDIDIFALLQLSPFGSHHYIIEI